MTLAVDMLRAAIDDLSRDVGTCGHQSRTTDFLINYLTANIDDLAENLPVEECAECGAELTTEDVCWSTQDGAVALCPDHWAEENEDE